MTWRGVIKNGTIVVDTPVSLPEGTVVDVEVRPIDAELDDWGEPLDPAFLIGDLAVDTGIPDLGKNIDHYLYGHPKVEGGDAE